MFIIAIVYKNRDLHKTINYFIVNVAVSDLIFPLIVLPVHIGQMQADSQHWSINGLSGLMFCKLFYFAALVSIQVSAQSLVWIAVDSFVAVVFPLKLGLISKKIRTIAIVSTWIFAGFLNSPSLIVAELVVSGNDTVCKGINYSETIFSDQKANVTYAWLQLTFLYVGPLFLITILYSAIAVALKRKNNALANTAPDVKRNPLRNRRQAMRMAVAIVVLYYVCATPNTLLHFLVYCNWRPSCAFQRELLLIARFSVYSSSVVNPTICLTFVRSYRRGLRNILCPWRRMPDKKITKPRGQITLKKMKNLTEPINRPRH